MKKVYRLYGRPSWITRHRLLLLGLFCTVVIIGGSGLYIWHVRSKVSSVSTVLHTKKMAFDSSIATSEQQSIEKALHDQHVSYNGTVSVQTKLQADNTAQALSVYVPVSSFYSPRLSLTKTDLSNVAVYLPSTTDPKIRSGLANALGMKAEQFKSLSTPFDQLPAGAVAFISLDTLTPNMRLLSFEGAYYLDSFQTGAVFRQAVFGDTLTGLKLNSFPAKDEVMKVNMTGVTALTRLMIKKLASVKDAAYFGQLIAPFLKQADIVHVSNEVSFNPSCSYSDTSFCAPPAMIDALKAIGVNLVELTGNHNNDQGNLNNTDTIKLYQQLGWHTFGGGLNTIEAAKPYIADIKGTKVAFVGYNAADGPNSGAIASASTAGGNSYSADRARQDIAAAKQVANFVIVDMQFAECQAYPEGFTEYPICDQPIPNQANVFRGLIDMGADMVIGTQAHQPQTYELYKGKPIYYGLGNLYFEQVQWPGTERGIILSHYFVGGKLLQTRLSPTIYDRNMQTHLMSDGDAVKFLSRLIDARTAAGL